MLNGFKEIIGRLLKILMCFHRNFLANDQNKCNTCVSDCGSSATGLSQFVVSDNINCQLSSNCTTLTCCMEDTVTRSYIQVQGSMDPCQFNLRLKIEKMTRDISLLNYTWGLFDFFILNNAWLESIDFIEKAYFQFLHHFLTGELEKVDLYGVYVIR